MSKAFLITGVLAALVGMGLGIFMGIKQDFTLAPAHAHINLVGYVTMVLAGLFYDRRPDVLGLLAKVHYITALIGAVGMGLGIAGVKLDLPWGEPLAIAASLVTYASMIIFFIQVARSSGMRAIV